MHPQTMGVCQTNWVKTFSAIPLDHVLERHQVCIMKCGQMVLGWGRSLSAWCPKVSSGTFTLSSVFHAIQEAKPKRLLLTVLWKTSEATSNLLYHCWNFLRNIEWPCNFKKKKKKRIGEEQRGGWKKALLPNCDLNWDWHQQTFPHQPLAHLVQTKQIEDLFCQWDHLAFLFMLQKEPVPVSHQSTRLLVAGLCCSFWLALIWDF